MSWPAWHTDPAARRHLNLRAMAAAAVTSLLAMPAVALFLRSSIVALSLDGGPMAGSGFPDKAIDVLGMVIMSPAVAWAYLLAAIPITRLLAARGRMGWAAVALAGSILGFLGTLVGVGAGGLHEGDTGAALRMALAGAGFALPFSLTFWLILRLSRPAAFRRDAPVFSVFE